VPSGAARQSWSALVRRFGEPAPGPAGLLLPPSPAVLATTPTWEFHRANVERRRADTVVRTMARAARLEEIRDLPRPEGRARLAAFPGVGPWTVAEVTRVALGDPDAVSVGDYHLKHQVTYALTGARIGTDEGMLALLEPWRGHRARAVRLLLLGGRHRPRRGPRMAHHSIARI
jgi:3-methyladenine DNA glycosylase/8-oxoguanine DNA glycosylase